MTNFVMTINKHSKHWHKWVFLKYYWEYECEFLIFSHTKTELQLNENQHYLFHTLVLIKKVPKLTASTAYPPIGTDFLAKGSLLCPMLWYIIYFRIYIFMSMLLRKHVKIYLADNFPLKVAENHFVEKKALTKMGGTTPPLLTKIAEKRWVKKG